MLKAYRVLDLTDHRGELAGMILGDLGADVIRVEPRKGSPARWVGPRRPDAPPEEVSLQFRAYNRNKRSIALDLSLGEDAATFEDLVRSADFVIESAPPSILGQHGFDFSRLRALQPQIVHVQITPFGSDGPRADWPAADLTLAALGGPMWLQGTADRAPVRVSVPQVWRHAGAEAVQAALLAHAQMVRTGEAQFVDVSAQAVMTWTMMNAISAPAVSTNFNRMGSILQLGVVTLPIVFECQDGYVVVAALGGMLQPMVEWLIEVEAVDASWAEDDWSTYQQRLLSGQPVAKDIVAIFGAIGTFLKGRKKGDLLQGGLERNITIAPVNSLADLLDFSHLKAREAFRPVRLPDREVRGAGLFMGATATPPAIRRPSPTLDEHGDEIRGELRASPRARPALSPPDHPALPLEGVKICDLAWVVAGPASTRSLVDQGALTIRVESEGNPCATRVTGPFKDGQPGLNRSAFFTTFNAGKKGIVVDLQKPEGVEIVKRLIEWADVFVENFRPGVIDRLGLGYEAARAVNPDIVMLSTSLMGSRGPARSLAGFGYHAGALAGFYEITGWSDLPPDGPWLAYTDVVAPHFQTASILGALDHRRRTGQGQHIEFAQLDAALQFLAPEILEFEAGGPQPMRIGNRALDAAPQGAYMCAGDDEWCAIAIETDAQWRALRGVLGDPEWAQASALDSAAGRLAGHDAIDEQLAAWTRTRAPRTVERTLIEAGIPAGVVQRASDLLEDPQYAQRGFWRTHAHPEMGRVPYPGPPYRVASYDAGARDSAPLFNEHTVEVLSEILGMSDEAIAESFASGAIG